LGSPCLGFFPPPPTIPPPPPPGGFGAGGGAGGFGVGGFGILIRPLSLSGFSPFFGGVIIGVEVAFDTGVGKRVETPLGTLVTFVITVPPELWRKPGFLEGLPLPRFPKFTFTTFFNLFLEVAIALT